jgi:hypothetical protein
MNMDITMDVPTPIDMNFTLDGPSPKRKKKGVVSPYSSSGNSRQLANDFRHRMTICANGEMKHDLPIFVNCSDLRLCLMIINVQHAIPQLGYIAVWTVAWVLLYFADHAVSKSTRHHHSIEFSTGMEPFGQVQVSMILGSSFTWDMMVIHAQAPQWKQDPLWTLALRTCWRWQRMPLMNLTANFCWVNGLNPGIAPLHPLINYCSLPQQVFIKEE